MDMETTTRVPTSVDELWMLVLAARAETPPTEEETA